MKTRPPVPKLADVAKMAGVGNATVSRALSGGRNVSSAAMERINAAIRQLNYQPNPVARSLKGSSSGIVGMIVPSISDAFFAKCGEAVEHVAKKYGALLVLVASHDQDDTVRSSLQRLLMQRIDGLILVPSDLQDAALVEALAHSRVPIIGIDRPLDRVGCSSVLCDNVAGAQLATAHLLQHGYGEVISIQVKPELFTMQERLRGYRAAMAGERRKPIEEVIASREDAVRLLKRLSSRSAATVGLFASNNLSARYLCEAMQVLQLDVPAQFALVSFDDFDLADTLRPPMSVVRQPVEAMGHRAAELLFDRLQNTETAADRAFQRIQLEPQLLIRQSCGCKP